MEDHYLIIACYLNDPNNQELHQKVTAWRALHTDNEKLYQQLYKTWLLSDKTVEISDEEVLLAMQRFDERFINTFPEEAAVIKPNFNWIRQVAAVLLVGVLGYGIYNFSTREVFVVKNTILQTDSVLLADGSKIFVNTHSSVKYPEQFKKQNREVYLTNGEAFFNITKNPEQPFIVHINNSAVKVLGTSFNIKSSKGIIAVRVNTGKVMFSTHKDGQTDTLTVGMSLTYNERTDELKKIEKPQSGADWLSKDINFVDATFQEVCAILQSYYDVSITIKGDVSKIRKLNASFSDETLDHILDALSTTYKIKIQKNGKNITIN